MGLAGWAIEDGAQRVPVDVLLGVGFHDDVAVACHRDAGAGVVAGALAQRDEGGHLAGDSRPGGAVSVALERERAGDAAPDPHGDDQAPAGGDLVQDRGGDVTRADGELHPVEGLVSGEAGRAVAEDDGRVRDAGRLQMSGGGVGEVLVDVDGPHVACLAR